MLEALVTLISVTALLLGSPGPAPLALAATSASFGIIRGLPFLMGILTGLSVAIVGSVAGLGALFAAYPSAKFVVQLLGAAYIVFVAYKIASAPISSNIDSVALESPSFRDGFILNLLNPKAYAAFLAIFSQFLLPIEPQSIALLVTGAVCLVVATVVDTAWLCVGGVLGGLFRHSDYARPLRVSLAILMVIAVLVVVLGY